MPPFPAATCVVVRDPPSGTEPEIFLVRRTSHASFLAGAHVFPGGRVDDADWEADDSWCDGLEAARGHWPDLDPAESVAYHIAAARELFEEAGLIVARDATGRLAAGDGRRAALGVGRTDLLEGRMTLAALMRDQGLRLALDRLLPLGHWVTPDFEPKRFDTRFFLTVAPPGQEATHDAQETTQGSWMTASEALERCRVGDIDLFPPTWGTLRDLARYPSVETAVALVGARAIFRREPRGIETGQGRLLVLPGDPLYPVPAEERVTIVHPETRFVHDGRRWVPGVPE